MVNEDSPIVDFYPLTFEIDMNGKRMAWQGVALLPFIDEQRLLDAMNPEYPKLTPEEVRRNRWGDNLLFLSDQHKLYPFVESQYGKKRRTEVLFSALPQLNVLHRSSLAYCNSCQSQWWPQRQYSLKPRLLTRVDL
jgi:5'-3' exonuclease